MARRPARRRKPQPKARGRSGKSARSRLPFWPVAVLAFLALGVYLAAPFVGRAVRSSGNGAAGLPAPLGGKVASACDGKPVVGSDDATFQTEPVSSQMTIVELLGDTRVNEQRKAAGLPELEADDRLRDVARTHSQDMFRRGFFAHQNPDGDEAHQRVHRQHRRLVGEVGENIWMCTGCWQGDVDEVVERMVLGPKGWMNSPGHRANILRDTFTHGVIAVWQNGKDVWATQVFSATRGYLKAGAPLRIAAGDCLALEVDAYPEGAVAASRFDLFSPSSERAVVDASPLGTRELDAVPGAYLLRFHFPKGAHHFSLVTGPAVQVQ